MDPQLTGAPAAGATAPPQTAGTRKRSRGLAGVVRRRLAVALPVLVATTFGMFALGAASPVDPAMQYAGAAAFTSDPAELDRLRANWGVDDPLLIQYVRWVGQLATGDLGWSTSLHQPVTAVLADRAGWTLLLTGTALALVLVVSIVLGSVAAYRRGGLFDRLLRAVAYGVEAMPVFWLALASIAVFAIGLGWLPSGGLTSLDAETARPPDVVRHLVLPVAVLAVSQSPWFVLFTRDAVCDALTSDHVLAARARGLSGRTILFGHALRTALLPYLTLIGTHLPELIGGAVLVEAVFSLPGLGAVSVRAALGSDFPLLAAITVLTTVGVLSATLAADLAYTRADPRVVLDG
jgi:peptide/nickel transport system permease protein